MDVTEVLAPPCGRGQQSPRATRRFRVPTGDRAVVAGGSNAPNNRTPGERVAEELPHYDPSLQDNATFVDERIQCSGQKN
jgi:hypothetical protein